MTKLLAVLVGVLALLLLGTTAQAKPTPAPAPQPYTPAYETVSNSVNLSGPSGESITVRATCPDGKTVIAGGFSADGPLVTYGTGPFASRPEGVASWAVTVSLDSGAPSGDWAAIKVYAICANTAAPTG